MCLLGPALSVDQHAKRVKLKRVKKGIQPDDTVLAWRVWKIEKHFPVTLRSESQSSIWLPGESMDGLVEEKGSAGVHCYTTLKDVVTGGYTRLSKTDFAQEVQVLGKVLLWGKIATHKNGFRAEHAYPFLLYVNSPTLQVRLRERYGCQVSRTFIPRLLAEVA